MALLSQPISFWNIIQSLNPLVIFLIVLEAETGGQLTQVNTWVDLNLVSCKYVLKLAYHSSLQCHWYWEYEAAIAHNTWFHWNLLIKNKSRCHVRTFSVLYHCHFWIRKEEEFAKYCKQTLLLCFYIVHHYRKAFFLPKPLIFSIHCNSGRMSNILVGCQSSFLVHWTRWSKFFFFFSFR